MDDIESIKLAIREVVVKNEQINVLFYEIANLMVLENVGMVDLDYYD